MKCLRFTEVLVWVCFFSPFNWHTFIWGLNHLAGVRGCSVYRKKIICTLCVERTNLISVGFVLFGRIILKICRISIACSNHDYSSCRFSSFCFWSGPVQLCIWRAFWITHVVVDILQFYCQVFCCQKEILSNHLPSAGPGIWFVLGNQDMVFGRRPCKQRPKAERF